MPMWAMPLTVPALLFSAFAVVASTHHCREHYALLQDLEAERWYLEEEHSRLLLEQSTWASHHRIENEAERLLGLSVPDYGNLRLVAP